jgi:hypothetical protein
MWRAVPSDLFLGVPPHGVFFSVFRRLPFFLILQHLQLDFGGRVFVLFFPVAFGISTNFCEGALFTLRSLISLKFLKFNTLTLKFLKFNASNGLKNLANS